MLTTFVIYDNSNIGKRWIIKYLQKNQKKRSPARPSPPARCVRSRFPGSQTKLLSSRDRNGGWWSGRKTGNPSPPGPVPPAEVISNNSFSDKTSLNWWIWLSTNISFFWKKIKNKNKHNLTQKNWEQIRTKREVDWIICSRDIAIWNFPNERSVDWLIDWAWLPVGYQY